MKVRKFIKEDVNGDRIQELLNTCQSMYDIHKDSKDFAQMFIDKNVSEEEMGIIWAYCSPSKENPYGKAFDDEVYDAVYLLYEPDLGDEPGDGKLAKRVFSIAKDYYNKHFTSLG